MKFNATSIRQHEASKLLTKNFLETGKNILGDGLKLCQRAKAHHTQDPDTAFIVVEKKAVKEKMAIRKSGLKRDQSSPASIMRMSVEMSAP